MKSKIDLADEIFVINVDGYIGESTESEILYALLNNKKVSYLEPPGINANFLIHNHNSGEKRVFKIPVGNLSKKEGWSLRNKINGVNIELRSGPILCQAPSFGIIPLNVLGANL